MISEEDLAEASSEADARDGARSAAPVVAPIMVLYVIGVAVSISMFSFDVWGGVVVGGVLAIAVFSAVIRVARNDPEPTAARLFVAAYAFKQLGTYARYYTVKNITGGDALGYDAAGKTLAPFLRAQDFGAPEFRQYVPNLNGTAVLRVITGIIYNVTGPSTLAGFMVFSTLAFVGLFLAYQAVRMAMPRIRHRLLAGLLFFLPSLLFWPSSIGKDSWVVMAIGLTFAGAARLYAARPGGIPLLAAGLGASAIVRPHITGILFVSLVAGRLIGRTSRHRAGEIRGFLTIVATIAFLGAAMAFTVSRASSFLESIGDGSVSSVLDETARRSSQGGSAFESARVTSPADVPWAFVTVLYRPFPNEAHNLRALVTAIESILLLLFTAASLRAFLRLPTLMRQHPLVTMVVIYILLFVFAFSAIANFGILVRQRTQVYPLLAILLAMPRRRARSSDHIATEEPESPRFALPKDHTT